MKQNLKGIFSKSENIFEVIGKMQTLIEYFKDTKKYNSLLPFLETYYLVTKKVAEKNIQNENYYQNPKALETLDIEFAWQYFISLEKYLKSKTKKMPWKNYFTYCEKNKLAFLEMFIGINVHINADLCVTLAKINYKEKKDFKKINKILEELIPKVMRNLAINYKDIFGFGGVVLEDFAKNEFKKIVVKWRNQAWKNSKKLRKDSTKKKEIYQMTEDVSKELIRIFSEDLFNPKLFLRDLEKIKVRI